MRFGLRDDSIENMIRIFEKYPGIENVILYGSRAKGNYKPGSDIDLTLIGKDLTLADLNRISFQLEELNLPQVFDISLFHQIDNRDLIKHINRIGITLFDRMH